MTLFSVFLSSERSRNPLEAIRSYLAVAIQIGAPAYNLGDHRGCYEVYACTARMLIASMRRIEEVRPALRMLRTGLRKASTVGDVNRQAWIMRHAFDAVLGEGDIEPGMPGEPRGQT